MTDTWGSEAQRGPVTAHPCRRPESQHPEPAHAAAAGPVHRPDFSTCPSWICLLTLPSGQRARPWPQAQHCSLLPSLFLHLQRPVHFPHPFHGPAPRPPPPWTRGSMSNVPRCTLYQVIPSAPAALRYEYGCEAALGQGLGLSRPLHAPSTCPSVGPSVYPNIRPCSISCWLRNRSVHVCGCVGGGVQSPWELEDAPVRLGRAGQYV